MNRQLQTTRLGFTARHEGLLASGNLILHRWQIAAFSPTIAATSSPAVDASEPFCLIEHLRPSVASRGGWLVDRYVLPN